MASVKLATPKIGGELVVDGLVSGYPFAGSYSGAVEGLARSVEGYGVFSLLCVYRGKRNMFYERQVTVDFIADDKDIVIQAYLGYFLEFRPGPYPSARVVRIAENHGLATLDLFFQL